LAALFASVPRGGTARIRREVHAVTRAKSLYGYEKIGLARFGLEPEKMAAVSDSRTISGAGRKRSATIAAEQ